jgi:hypothetical protein
MALAIIGGMPERFVPYTDLYKETYRKHGHDPARRNWASTRTATSPTTRSGPPTNFTAPTPT